MECRAQAWAPTVVDPELTLTSTASVIVLSRTGACRRVVVPSPTWPASLRPQHETPPRKCRMQALSSPTETFTASLMLATWVICEAVFAR